MQCVEYPELGHGRSRGRFLGVTEHLRVAMAHTPQFGSFRVDQPHLGTSDTIWEISGFSCQHCRTGAKGKGSEIRKYGS